TVEGKRLDSLPPTVTRLAVSFSIESLAVGDFAGDLRHEIALLSNDGVCRIFERASQAKGGRWQQASATTLPNWQKAQPDAPLRSLITARVSSSPKDDLLLLDQQGSQ